MNGKLLASLSSDNGVIKIWDLALGALVSKISLRDRSVGDLSGTHCLFLSPDGAAIFAFIARKRGIGETTPLIEKQAIAIGWNAKTGQQIWETEQSDFRDAA